MNVVANGESCQDYTLCHASALAVFTLAKYSHYLRQWRRNSRPSSRHHVFRVYPIAHGVRFESVSHGFRFDVGKLISHILHRYLRSTWLKNVTMWLPLLSPRKTRPLFETLSQPNHLAYFTIKHKNFNVRTSQVCHCFNNSSDLPVRSIIKNNIIIIVMQICWKIRTHYS